jgi:hypothetical protein
MNRILWGFAKQLEYPDAIVLKRFADRSREQIERLGSTLGSVSNESGYAHLAMQIMISPTSQDYVIAERLRGVGVCRVVPVNEPAGSIGTGLMLVTPNLEIVQQLLEFVFVNFEGGGHRPDRPVTHDEADRAGDVE